MERTTYAVRGMTCEHCRVAVRQEVGAVAGVAAVDASARRVGLPPLVLCHVVAGAHNEALVMLVSVAGVGLWLGGRELGGVAMSTAARARSPSRATTSARPPSRRRSRRRATR